MGIFGAGNTGSAITKLVAPLLIVAYGTWTMVPQIYAVLMLVTAILFWLFTFSDKSHVVGAHVTIREQLKVLKDPRVWRYSQYYSIVFGGYVALALWMTKYYMSEYQFELKDAAMLEKVQVGSKVKFKAEKADGAIVVTNVEVVQ